MVSLSDVRHRPQAMPSLGLAVAILALLTAIRLVGLKFSVVDLFFDEAQYWVWSRELDFGYFSKPPLLAWTIALAEQVCGSSEACIRAPAPVLYFGTSLIVYAIAHELYDARVAFYAALSTALATGCVFSSRIISTDVPLLFFWALALLAFVKLMRGRNAAWTVVLGVSIGLGLLAKYAMIYFLLGVALAAWFDADARRVARSGVFWFALLVATIVVTPNIIWNINHGLATFRHTGDNIEGGGLAFSPAKGFEFLAAQFGVFGPVVFAVLLYAFVRLARDGLGSKSSDTDESKDGALQLNAADRVMLAFAIPPLALVTAVGFVTRALANWAAPTFISATIVVVAILVRRKAWTWLAVSLAIGVVAQVALIAGDAVATNFTIPGVRDGDVYRRTLGWRSLGEQAGALARRVGARTIVGEERQEEASLIYYWRDQPEPVLAWPRRAEPEHHFDLTRALDDDARLPILFITRCAAQDRLTAQFSDVQPLGRFDTPSGPTTRRSYYAFKLDGRLGSIRPIAACRN